MIYFCCDDRRRDAVAQHPTLMGIDFLEVESEQQQLRIHFVPAAAGLVKTIVPPLPLVAKDHVRISGGERITSIRANSVVLDNRPGLSAIVYRAGSYTQFRDSMFARLSAAQHPALAGLRTRDGDDFSIALLDAWATVADVLTFYQERIANENYLRTATERRSLLELARLIGYELRPGVAASTALAFTLEEAAGSPRRITIDRGSKVQSIPGPNEKPQTFETIESIEARVEWNALRPVMRLPKVPAIDGTYAYLKGTATNLKPGSHCSIPCDVISRRAVQDRRFVSHCRRLRAGQSESGC